VFINGFPMPELPAVVGEPKFSDIQINKRLLKANALCVNLVLGGGRHGHLGLTMTAHEYDMMAAATPIIAPLEPCTLSIIAPGMDNVEAKGMLHLHNELRRIYME
jgi:hypothetical protein